MQALRDRLRDIRSSEGGFSLIEVIVALFIFAIISTGTAYTMMSVIQVTRDSRARHVATNLAAQEIDLARDIDDLFTLLDAERTVSLNGDTFHVKRATQWVTSASLTSGCGGASTATAPTAGGAGASLRYKRVNVTVSWDGMRKGTSAVRADTVIDPTSRINDPTRGTILVSVLSVSGAGMPGVTVTATPASPANGAIAPSAPTVTDAQGCTYILKVYPGNYNVAISKIDNIDVDQKTAPVKLTSVAVGASSSVGFQYDKATTVTATYSTKAPAGTVVNFPNNLDTSYFSSAGVALTTLTGSGVNTTSVYSTPLHPFSSGYQLVSGKYVAPSSAATPPQGCVSVDPLSWPASVVAGVTQSAGRSPVAASAPGGSAATSVVMGAVKVTIPGLSGTKYLRAVSAVAPAGTGDPKCFVGMTYTFGQVLVAAGTTVALPWGSWTLSYSDSATSSLTTITSAQLAVVAPGANSGNVVTLDPRGVTP